MIWLESVKNVKILACQKFALFGICICIYYCVRVNTIQYGLYSMDVNFHKNQVFMDFVRFLIHGNL